jgi:hypothetical protein
MMNVEGMGRLSRDKDGWGLYMYIYMNGSCLLNPGVTDEQGNHNYDAWVV